MARAGVAIIAGLTSALALAGCGSTGSSSLFSSSALDLFKSTPKATKVDASNPASLVDTDYDCPEVKVRAGAATLMIGSKPGEGEPSALNVRYQGSIVRTARECHLAGNVMTIKVGVEGRIITGPAGGAGTIDVPLRIAVVQEGLTPKVVTSNLNRQAVTINGAVDRVNFTIIDPAVSFPLPTPVTDITSYVVYVGFDPQSAQPEKKKPAAKKPKARPTSKPRSS